MAYEDRQNGTHAMTCDTPGCSHECLSPGEDELHEDMALAGWTKVGKNKAGDDLFQCSACNQGMHPAAAALHRATGGTGEVPVEAPKPVRKGDACYDPQGDLLGHYTADADQGDVVNVKVQLPEPPKPPSAVELYDDMMEGSDADDDKHGRVSAVAPVGAVGSVGSNVGSDVPVSTPAEKQTPAAPTPRSMGAPAGATGSGGAVKQATKPDLTSPEAKSRLLRAPSAPRGPVLDTGALDETAALFDNLDPTANDWDPDE